MSNNVVSERKEKFIIHGIVNFCLVCIVVLTMLFCGVLGGENDVMAVNKTYNGVIYAGDENSGKVALMINVYWGTEYLDSMLETLNKYDAKCTFFVGKTWVKDHENVLQKIYDCGHEIANHGSNHKEHANLSYEANISEIDDCTKIVKQTVGVDMNLFAPPGGSYSQATVKAAESLGYKTILWTHDTIDWRDQDVSLIISRATSEMVAGDLILMHPTSATAEALESILKIMQTKGLKPDIVSNVIK
ncbi:MAG: polysaccharide deacetylase family protein [Clostridia bacterium]|nr:polysaccharide deacetylase family protein [Clostridia bacterium]